MKKFHYQQKKTTRYYFGQIIELKFNLPLKKPRESGQNCSSSRFLVNIAKSREPGGGDPKTNKSYHVLLSKCKDQLITTKFQFFKETAAKMNIFLKRFQTDAPMMPFLVDTLHKLIRYMCIELCFRKSQNKNFIDKT